MNMALSRVFLYGIDKAGKTAIVLTIKNKKTIETTIPTLAFNIEKLVIKDPEFQISACAGPKNFT